MHVEGAHHAMLRIHLLGGEQHGINAASWHPADETAAVLSLYQAQSHADMPTAGLIFRHFIQLYVSVNNLQQ